MIDVESFIIFFASCFFTLLWLASDPRDGYWLGYVSGLLWNILGVDWLFLTAAAPATGSYAIGLIFNGIGIIFLLVSTVQVFQKLDFERYGFEGEESLP